MRVLVMTVVHHPEDARILHRQIRGLVDAGHQVVQAAPFSAFGVQPRPWVSGVDLPRAGGRRRAGAIRFARTVLRDQGGKADVVLLHDPELLLAVGDVRKHVPVVWDVHEDTAAALGMKAWLPGPLRPAVRLAVRLAESAAERRLHLILAEPSYAGRFRREHLVVPNYPYVPDSVAPPAADRVVYVGSLSAARGAAELVATARLLAPHGVRAELVGPADGQVRGLIEAAAAEGVLDWAGYQSNDEALRRLDGALAGLTLLHDQPNYRHSLPTKVVEYMARGVPVITTPLPRATRLVETHRCGLVVPWQDPEAVAKSVLLLREDRPRREALGRNGHAAALEHYSWPVAARRFIAQLEAWAGAAG
ncbi:MAG: glycosyltransferase [Sporichthyaceae bacterium]|nr:glycosyltransferase [Sporichthyaceae bacterium]